MIAKRPLQFIALLAFVFSAFFLIPTNARADFGGFTVAPPKLENIQVAPGQTITGTIEVFTKSSEHYQVDVGDVTQQTNGAYLFTKQSKDPRDTSSWISVTPKNFVSGPGDREPITWTLSVPKGAEPGDHLGTIFVTQLADENSPTKNGAVLQAQVAVRLEITVQGPVTFNPVINQLDVPTISSDKTIPMDVTIVNKGNVRVDLDNAKAYLEIFNGKTLVARHQLKDAKTTNVIFPGNTRVYHYTYKNAPKWAKMKARVSIDFQDKTKGKVSRQQTFYLFPYKLVIAIAIILLALLLLLLGWLAARNRHDDDDWDDEDDNDIMPITPAADPAVSDEEEGHLIVDHTQTPPAPEE